MVDIVSISHGTSSGLLYDIHHIVILVLRLIGEDYRLAAQDEEASTSHGPSISLLRHPLQLRCSRSEVKREGEVVLGDFVVELVSEVVVDRVVPLMRLPYHPRDFHTTQVFHITLLDFHSTRVFHTTPKDFRSTSHAVITTHISGLRSHITIYDITCNIASH